MKRGIINKIIVEINIRKELLKKIKNLKTKGL